MTDQSTPLSAQEERELREDISADPVRGEHIYGIDVLRLLATLDAARERPSALDVETLYQAILDELVVLWGEPSDAISTQVRPIVARNIAAEYARLTEPDAGEGTERITSTDQLEAEQRGLPIPFAPAPDTTEATLRARVKRFLLAYDSTDAWEVVDAEVDALRAALQQPAAQPEPTWQDLRRRITAHTKGGTVR